MALYLIRMPRDFDAKQLVGLTLDAASSAPTPIHALSHHLRPLPLCEAEGFFCAMPDADDTDAAYRLSGVTRLLAVESVPAPPERADNSHATASLPPVPKMGGLKLRHAFAGGALPGKEPPPLPLPPTPTGVTSAVSDGATPSPVLESAGSKKGSAKKKKRRSADESASDALPAKTTRKRKKEQPK